MYVMCVLMYDLFDICGLFLVIMCNVDIYIVFFFFMVWFDWCFNVIIVVCDVCFTVRTWRHSGSTWNCSKVKPYNITIYIYIYIYLCIDILSKCSIWYDAIVHRISNNTYVTYIFICIYFYIYVYMLCCRHYIK